MFFGSPLDCQFVTIVLFAACTFVTCFNKHQSINQSINQSISHFSFNDPFPGKPGCLPPPVLDQNYIGQLAQIFYRRQFAVHVTQQTV